MVGRVASRAEGRGGLLRRPSRMRTERAPRLQHSVQTRLAVLLAPRPSRAPPPHSNRRQSAASRAAAEATPDPLCTPPAPRGPRRSLRPPSAGDDEAHEAPGIPGFPWTRRTVEWFGVRGTKATPRAKRAARANAHHHVQHRCGRRPQRGATTQRSAEADFRAEADLVRMTPSQSVRACFAHVPVDGADLRPERALRRRPPARGGDGNARRQHGDVARGNRGARGHGRARSSRGAPWGPWWQRDAW